MKTPDERDADKKVCEVGLKFKNRPFDLRKVLERLEFVHTGTKKTSSFCSSTYFFFGDESVRGVFLHYTEDRSAEKERYNQLWESKDSIFHNPGAVCRGDLLIQAIRGHRYDRQKQIQTAKWLKDHYDARLYRYDD